MTAATRSQIGYTVCCCILATIPAPKKSNTKTHFLFLIIFLSRWRGRNHLSYLRAKSHYDSQPGEASEHPLIYDDANIQFYRGNNAYLLEPGNRQRCPASMSAIGLLPQSASTGMVRDTSGLSQQVGLLALLWLWSIKIGYIELVLFLLGYRRRCPASMLAIGLLPQSASTGMVRDTSGLSQQVGLLA